MFPASRVPSGGATAQDAHNDAPADTNRDSSSTFRLSKRHPLGVAPRATAVTRLRRPRRYAPWPLHCASAEAEAVAAVAVAAVAVAVAAGSA
mgnify:CR=1 FL=1